MTITLIPDFEKKSKPNKTKLLILKNLKNCQKITDYLKLRVNKDETKRAYGSYIRDYFILLNITNINDYFKDPRRLNNNKKIDYTDKIEKNIENFNNHLKTYSGSKRLGNLSAIRKLLEFNKIELGNDFWLGLRKNGKKAIRETQIETPTTEQLRKILSNADIEAKAFFLMQMTSCSRIEEISTLTFDNLHLDTLPPSFYIPKEHSKNGKPITKFFSEETKALLKEYIDEYRDNFLETRLNRSLFFITKNKKLAQEYKEKYKNLVFPMSSSNIETIWNNLCVKVGLYKLDPNTKHPIMGTHCLRRYFEDNIGNVKLAKYMANKLTKSEEPYTYKTKNKLEEEYQNYQENIYVFETPKRQKDQLEKFKTALAEKNEEINDLKTRMKIIDDGRTSSNNKYKELEQKINNIYENLETRRQILNMYNKVNQQRIKLNKQKPIPLPTDKKEKIKKIIELFSFMEIPFTSKYFEENKELLKKFVPNIEDTINELKSIKLIE